MSSLYIFEQRNSNLSKNEGNLSANTLILSMRDLAFTEQLAGHYGVYTNDQLCTIDESLISHIYWILVYEMCS